MLAAPRSESLLCRLNRPRDEAAIKDSSMPFARQLMSHEMCPDNCSPLPAPGR